MELTCLFVFLTAIWIPEVSSNNTEVVAYPGDPDTQFCGLFHALAQRWITVAGVKHHPYYLNVTAAQLEHDGFQVTVNQVFRDFIWNVTFSNETFTDTIAATGFAGIAAVGGRPALKLRAYYMALIGEVKRNKTTWFCDGVLINNRWVLSAAHCFIMKSVTPNIIRLGDYDWNTAEENEEPIYDQPIDYTISETFFYPDFDETKRYHDLILIKLSKDIPQESNRILPICLPWGDETGRNLVGFNVTLTGWGATSYKDASAVKTSILQEVDLVVFEPEVCNSSYAKLASFSKKWSEGMGKDDILCVGWEEGGRDACKGDSGGPVVYQNGGSGSIFLAGIVSGGYGCGFKEFPGLYIPINRPKYLQWIKQIAF